MRLREARLERFLTAAELAQRAKVGESTVYAIEMGREVPTLRTARKLAEALGLDPREVDEFRQRLQLALKLEGATE